jgi:ribosomal protein RSM22 (predicted rRNA methylase)
MLRQDLSLSSDYKKIVDEIISKINEANNSPLGVDIKSIAKTVADKTMLRLLKDKKTSFLSLSQIRVKIDLVLNEIQRLINIKDDKLTAQIKQLQKQYNKLKFAQWLIQNKVWLASGLAVAGGGTAAAVWVSNELEDYILIDNSKMLKIPDNAIDPNLLPE